MRLKAICFLFLSSLPIVSCATSDNTTSIAGKATNEGNAGYVAGRPASFESDSAMLDYIQKVTLNYMWEGAEPTSGLAPERIHLDGPIPRTMPMW